MADPSFKKWRERDLREHVRRRQSRAELERELEAVPF